MEIVRTIGPQTERYAVLGERLGHTWSPYIHNTLFKAAGMDAVYLPVTIDREHLASVVDVLRYSFSGFNVTIPYKERILPFLDELDARAEAMLAVNTVEIRDGRLIGHITDGLGMMRAIMEKGIGVDGISALILGGGGAARVAGYEILERGGKVMFALRSPEKGPLLVRSFLREFPDAAGRIDYTILNGIKGSYDLVINCTPVGMYPDTERSPVDRQVLERCGAVFDAVYNPRVTRLLQMAGECGIPAVEGFGMLYYQAVEAERFWNPGRVPEKSVLREIYQSLLCQL